MTKFEDLPNELLTDIFKTLDARTLFRAFANLNTRLNELIQSIDYLQLVFHLNQSMIWKSNAEIFPYYVHTLIVDPWIDFHFKSFPNLHTLRLHSPLPKVLEQLKPDFMPYLEHLSVVCFFHMYEMFLLCERIFSNSFHHLKSCQLSEKQRLMQIPTWRLSPSIHRLEMEFLDATVYQTILSACPNLYFLKFWMFSFHGIPTDDHFSHSNLQYMIIEFRESTWSIHDDHALSGFLSCVPNLQKLQIHRRISLANMTEYLERYDWLASIIQLYLSQLKQFQFVLHLLDDGKLPAKIEENLFFSLEKTFLQEHQGSYRARLKMSRESL